MDTVTLHAAMMRRLRRRVKGAGVMIIPAVPTLIDYYSKKLLAAFALLERPFGSQDADKVRELLGTLAEKAWKASPYGRLEVMYESDAAPDGGITYKIKTVIATVAEEYDGWIGSRPQPFFGAHANAKVLWVAHSLGPPATVPVLDIGAGPGRNTLPLARAGFPTDAVEISSGFAQMLRASLAEEKLPGRVFHGDMLDPNLELPRGHYKLVVLAGVLVAHVRGTDQLRQVLELVSRLLAPGGQVVFSIFRALDGFEPDALTRQLEEVFWTMMFTARELESVVEGLGLELVDDVSYVDYERDHLPESWPPTDYFENYAYGVDLFDLPAGRAPVDLRWLTYRRV